MIRMRMRDDGVLDVGWIESQLLHAFGDLIFDGIVKDGVDDDDALRCRDRPHGVLGLAEKVEVIENLYRSHVPGRAIRRTGLARCTAGRSRNWGWSTRRCALPAG